MVFTLPGWLCSFTEHTTPTPTNFHGWKGPRLGRPSACGQRSRKKTRAQTSSFALYYSPVLVLQNQWLLNTQPKCPHHGSC